MTPRDMNRETLGQSMNQGFKHLGVSESRVEAEMQYTLLARYVDISLERISCRHDQPTNVNLLVY